MKKGRARWSQSCAPQSLKILISLPISLQIMHNNYVEVCIAIFPMKESNRWSVLGFIVSHAVIESFNTDKEGNIIFVEVSTNAPLSSPNAPSCLGQAERIATIHSVQCSRYWPVSLTPFLWYVHLFVSHSWLLTRRKQWKYMWN